MTECAEAPEAPEISFGSIASFLRDHRRTLALCAAAGAVLLSGFRLSRGREYTAEGSFIPETRRNQSPVSGLAAQFGLAGLASEGSQSPQFFADLATGPTVSRHLLQQPYVDTANGQPHSTSLLEVLHARGRTAGERVADGMERLRGHITTIVSPKTGLVVIRVTMPSAALSAAVADRVVQLVNDINLRLRQSQAEADRQFAEARVAELGAELRAAENRLQDFLQANRDYRTSPRLTLEEDRLARQVSMRQDVYNTMARSYEQDRIESARDIPVIAVVDSVVTPAKPDSRGVTKAAVGGLLLGLFVGVVLAALADFWRRRGASPDSAAHAR